MWRREGCFFCDEHFHLLRNRDRCCEQSLPSVRKSGDPTLEAFVRTKFVYCTDRDGEPCSPLITRIDVRFCRGKCKNTAESIPAMCWYRFRILAKTSAIDEAVELLVSGHSVKEVAFSVGYQEPTAFVALFRATFGTTPKAWISTLDSLSRG